MTEPAAPKKSLLSLSWPLILSFWMRSLFTFVDSVFAGFLGDASLAAIGLAIPLEFIFIATWVGLSTGLTSTASKAIGSHENEKVDQLVATVRRMVMGLIPLFLAGGVAIYLVAPHLELEAKVAAEFAIYGSVLFAGSALTGFWSIIPDSLVKAHHDTRTTMIAGILSNVVNVSLNTLFLFVFEWGIFGIAFSTVFGRFGGLIYATIRANALEAERRQTARELHTPGQLERPGWAILALALPSAGAYLLMASEGFIINFLLATLEHATEALAAYAIAYRFIMFGIMPLIATSVAVLPFVARRFGEGEVEDIRSGIRQVLVWGSIYCLLVLGPAYFFLAPWLAQAFTNNPLTLRYTVFSLQLAPVMVLAMGPFFICRSAFEGLQRGTPGLVMAVLRYVVLCLVLGLTGVWLAERLGHPEYYGLLVGLGVASLVVSTVFLIWYGRVVGQLEEGQAVA